MDRDERKDQNPGIVYPDRGDSIAMQVAFSDADRQSYVKLSLCIALYAVLALIWMPGIHLGNRVYDVDEKDHAVQRRIVLRPPPVKPLETVRTKEKKAKKTPMPDRTPDEPEPQVVLVEQTEPTLVTTDDWEIGIPDSVPEGKVVAVVGQTGVDAPIFLRKVAPKYPPEGIQIRLQGYVVLQAILGKDGSVSDIRVLRGLGKGKFGFEQEAIDSLKQWTFLPGKLNGQPEDVRMNLRVDFILQ